MPRLRIRGIYLQTLRRLHGVVLKNKDNSPPPSLKFVYRHRRLVDGTVNGEFVPVLNSEPCHQYNDWATGWTTRVRFPAGAGILSLRHLVQTGSEAHPASCAMGSWGLSPQGKAAGT